MKCPACSAEFMTTKVNRNLAGMATCPQCGQPLEIGDAELAEDVAMRERLAGVDASLSAGTAPRSLVSDAVPIGDGAFALDVAPEEEAPIPRLAGSADFPELNLAAAPQLAPPKPAAPAVPPARPRAPRVADPATQSASIKLSLGGAAAQPPPAESASIQMHGGADIELAGDGPVPQLASSARVGGAGAAAEEVFADSLAQDGLPSLKEVAPPKPVSAPEPPPVQDWEDPHAPPGEGLEAVARAPSRVSRLQTPDAGVSLEFLDGSGVRIAVAVVVAVLIGAVIVHSVFSGGDEIADEELAGLFVSTDEAEARLEAGKKKAAAGDHAGALRDLEDVLQADPDLVEVYLVLSVSYEELGMYDEAAEALTRYLEARPDAANADTLRKRLVMLAE